MNNIFYEMIFRRKSFHTFRNVGNESISENELNDIQNAYSELAPLNPEIKTAIRIVPEKETNCKRGGEYCILFYSEKKDGYLQNIGYIGEQLDLYLVSRNIGTLWLGIGKTKEEHFENMEFVIMFSIRKISDSSKYRKDMFKSKRKSVEEIWEGKQIPYVSDIVRFAPSACNSQPWHVKNDGELSVYRYKKPGNATIVTNAMTDQVCVMNSDGKHGWVERTGYPSEEKIKKDIVNYLEGGVESFKHKSKIYRPVLK